MVGYDQEVVFCQQLFSQTVKTMGNSQTLQPNWTLLKVSIPYICSNPIAVNDDEFVVVPCRDTCKDKSCSSLQYKINEDCWQEKNEYNIRGRICCFDKTNKEMYICDHKSIQKMNFKTKEVEKLDDIEEDYTQIDALAHDNKGRLHIFGQCFREKYTFHKI